MVIALSAMLNTGLKNISPPKNGTHSGKVKSGKYNMSTTLPCMKPA